MRHKHNLSHHHLFTADLGQLVPVGLVETLPGDVFQHSSSVMVRFSPLLAPMMHPVRVRLHHFFVPMRLAWDDTEVSFEDFITGGPDGNNAYQVPTLTSTGTAKDLLDYMGIPTESGIEVASMPIRAFNLIFNEWYRDQDLVTARGLEDLDVPLISWEKTYETTARPWAQRGDAVSIPLGTEAPVLGIGKENQTYSTSNQNVYETDGTGTTQYTNSYSTNDGTPNRFFVEEDPNNSGYPNIRADLTSASSATITALRNAFAIQRFKEQMARYGQRYAEYLERWGVRGVDSRIQEPEYLGGGTETVGVSEVLQTGPDANATTAEGVADMYGHGIAASRIQPYRRRFPEWGYVVSCMSVRPKLMFAQGIERTWLRRDKEDYFIPELEHIGQQQVLEQELFADSTNAANVFGWSDRYAEYRQQRSRVSGEFRTSTLDHWHLAQIYSSAPALNSTFVECNPSKRVFAEQTNNNLWCAVKHNIAARRKVGRGGPRGPSL